MGSLSKGKKKNIPKSINDMSKEMLQETLKKKKECNAKALETVEKLCEASVDEDWFLANLQFINQTHFDDVTVERAIIKLCGYPLCNEKLEKIPSQQYHISTRYNKVFDITERKNFCSSSCYKSAQHVKNQLFTSPLWFRDQEVIPKYTVLKSQKSSMGEEVVFVQEKIKLEEDVKVIEEKCLKLSMDEPQVDCVKKVEFVKKEDKDSGNIDGRVKVKTKEKDVDSVRKVEKSIFEWFSLDSLFYLHTEEKLREMFSDKVNKLKEVLNSKLEMTASGEKIDRLIRLYGLLETNTSVKTNLKPLPDYSALKEEGKNLEIKVRAFYQGQLEIKESKKEEKEETPTENPIYLPLIDAHAQSTLRKKIVLDKLNRVLPELIRIFHSDYLLSMAEVRNLVSTFNLSADNITYKPSEWYLMGIILIKLMSIKDQQLESIIRSDFSQSQISVILKNFQLEEGYLDNLIKRLTDGLNVLETT